MKNVWRVWVVLLLGACAADPEPVPIPEPEGGPAAKQARSGAEPQEGTLVLSLERCMGLALGGNYEIRLGGLAPKMRAEDFYVAGEVFAPAAWMEASGGTDRDSSISVFNPKDLVRDSDFLAEGGVGKLWGIGLRTDLLWAYSRNKTNSTFFTLNPRHEASVAFEAVQPLMAGFGVSVNRAELDRALNDRRIADAEFEVVLEAELLRAYLAYWDLVLTAEDLALQEQSLTLAEEQVAIARDRLAAGVAARLEVTSAEAAHARQRESVIDAQTAYRKAADRLLRIIRPSPDPEGYQLTIVPTTKPDLREALPPPPAAAQAAREALNNRPELRREEYVVANTDLDILLAEDGGKVKLDLFGRFGIDGAAGTPRKVLEELELTKFRDWSLGVSLEFLLDKESRRARIRRAMLSRQEGALRRRAIAASIVVEVRAALFELKAAHERLQATRRTLTLAQEQYDGEVDRLRNGRSTQYQVELLRRDLLDAQRNSLHAQVRVFLARAILDAARGTFAKSVVGSAS